MSPEQAADLVATLRAAYPSSRNAAHADTAQVYASLLSPLDHDLASAAVRELIGRSRSFPTFAEIRRAYRLQAAAQRREQESAPLDASEATLAARRAQAARMRAWMADRWPTAPGQSAGTGSAVV
jgi:hypothetical protein